MSRTHLLGALLLAVACAPVPDALPEAAEVLAHDDADPPVTTDAHEEVATNDAGPTIAERLGLPPPRKHELWPVPVMDACPTVMFGSITPMLTAGDMHRRVVSHFTHRQTASPSWSIPTAVMVLRDHLELHGVRLIAAADYGSGCMMGWWHVHCLATADELYCPGDARSTLTRFVRDHRLVPTDLDRSAWLELVTVLLGVEQLVLEPDDPDACTHHGQTRARAPQVTLADDRVRVQLTALVDRRALFYTVEIFDDGRVEVAQRMLWQRPEPEDVWGAL